jgi:hypothetical protein
LVTIGQPGGEGGKEYGGAEQEPEIRMTPDGFRGLALAFPESAEGSHMDHPDFRVRGKIFATLHGKEAWGMVKLTPDQQEAWVEAEPEVYVPVPGGWGVKGATYVVLKRAKKASVRRALMEAWRNTAPKELVQKFEG